MYHPPIPAVSLKERQQGAGTGLDHRQWVWGRRHWHFRPCIHWLQSTDSTTESHSTKMRPPDSFRCLEIMVTASRTDAMNHTKKLGPSFSSTSWQVEHKWKLMSSLLSQLLLQGRTAFYSTNHISKCRHKCSCALFLLSEKRISCSGACSNLPQESRDSTAWSPVMDSNTVLHVTLLHKTSAVAFPG